MEETNPKLSKIEEIRHLLSNRVSEQNGDFLDEAVLELSRKLDESILEYMKTKIPK
jgi:hypothetical protein